MKKIKDKSKLFMIIGITIFVVALLGSAYAYYRFVLLNINVNTITRGLDYYIVYNKGTDITSAVLNPSDDYTGGNSIDVTLYKKDNTYDIYGHIYLDITQIGDNLKNSRALRYTVLDGDTIISEGNLKNATGSVCLASNIVLGTTVKNYTIYLWFDNLNSTGNESNDTIKANIRCEASMKKILVPNYNTTYLLSNKVVFAPNKLVENNNIYYKYDTSNNLMEDIDGNIRYYGSSPNNYIYFNCSDYSNQSSDTCETWRIIGVFDGKVKIMRGSQIVTYAWDNKNTSTGAESTNGKNDWSTARLMKLLNPSDYYEVDSNDNGNGQSLYWNSQSGTCFVGQNNATKACDFTSTGLKNDTTRNMISESMWYLRGYNRSSVYSDQIYEYERTKGSVVSGRPTSWKGKIALAYPSDYGYAADFGQCTQTLVNYDDSTCTSNNWMKSIITNNGNNYGWLLTPNSGNSHLAWGVDSSSFVYDYYNTCNAYGAGPVLYLGSELKIKAGDGSSSTPYQLSA